MSGQNDDIFSPKKWFTNDKFWNSSSSPIPSLPGCVTQNACEFNCINYNKINPNSTTPCVGYNFSRLGFNTCSPTTGRCEFLSKNEVDQLPINQDALKTWSTYILRPRATAVSPTVVAQPQDLKRLSNYKLSTLILSIILGVFFIILYIIRLVKNKKNLN